LQIFDTTFFEKQCTFSSNDDDDDDCKGIMTVAIMTTPMEI